MRKAWFRNKRYGFGYSPSSWEGWTATVAFVVLAVLNSRFTRALFPDPMMGRLATVGVLAVLVLALVLLAVGRTDGPMRWRWGRDKD